MNTCVSRNPYNVDVDPSPAARGPVRRHGLRLCSKPFPQEQVDRIVQGGSVSTVLRQTRRCLARLGRG